MGGGGGGVGGVGEGHRSRQKVLLNVQNPTVRMIAFFFRVIFFFFSWFVPCICCCCFFVFLLVCFSLVSDVCLSLFFSVSMCISGLLPSPFILYFSYFSVLFLVLFVCFVGFWFDVCRCFSL